MELKAGYKQTDVGVIPEDWTCAELNDFISFISYGFTNPMPTTNSGPYMVTAADINKGRINLETARHTNIEAYEKLLTAKSKPKKNDILLTKDGTLGRVAIAGDEQICINQSVAILRANARTLPTFLASLLQGEYYQKRMIDDAGGSTIKHIYITIVNRMKVGVPCLLEEQQAIVKALSDIDLLIASLDLLIAKKRDLKQAAMQQLLTGNTRLQGFSGEWEARRLGEVAEIIMGQSPSSQHYNTKGDGLPLIQGNADLKHRKTIERVFSVSVTKLGLAGDIVMSVRAPVGEIAIASSDVCLGRGVCALRYQNDYLFHYLVYCEDRWSRLSKGSTFDAVNGDDIRAFMLERPVDEREQVAIASVLTDLDAELAELEQRRDKTIALKQGMMQELLTGKTRLV